MRIRSTLAGATVAAVAAFAAIATASAQSQPDVAEATASATVVEASPAPEVGTPATRVVEPVCEDHAFGGSEVERIAWDEVAELDGLGIPVCHVRWEFSDYLEGSEDDLGSALYRQGLLWINTDFDLYGEGGRDEAELRSVVRHEIGHFLVRWSSMSEHEPDLRQRFADPVIVDGVSRPGTEVAAEAIGVVLSDLVGDDFQLHYVDSLSQESLDAAAAIVDEFTW